MYIASEISEFISSTGKSITGKLSTMPKIPVLTKLFIVFTFELQFVFTMCLGSKEVCQILLENGAKPGLYNSVNRTATQMAAFVGE